MGFRVSDTNPRKSLVDESKIIADGFKYLFEKKHLYQNYTIEASIHDDKRIEETNNLLKTHKWFEEHPFMRQLIPALPTSQDRDKQNLVIPFSVSSIKVMCAVCKRTEPFNLKYANDLCDYDLPAGNNKDGIVQNFLFVFECQSCKIIPDVFLVRRQNLKITLCGRSPIEVVEVPKDIPKSVRQYCSDAIIAYNSGQTLASLFLLRTLIEQYIRNLNLSSETLIDRLLDLYMDKLPEDFKSRFPSLKNIYSQLSEAIHKADPSTELFQKSLESIYTHFDAKRLYKLQP